MSNQQVVVWRLTSERDVTTDSLSSLFHMELAQHLWLTALFLIIHLALGVWRSGDHLLGLGCWGEVALSSNIYWPAVLPIHSRNTQSPSLNTAQIHTQQLGKAEWHWYSLTACEGCWLGSTRVYVWVYVCVCLVPIWIMRSSTDEQDEVLIVQPDGKTTWNTWTFYILWSNEIVKLQTFERKYISICASFSFFW